jgi:S1-C subfamily serine protease
MAAYMGLPGKSGLLVRMVEKKSPAEAAGIRVGDVLLSVGRQELLARTDYTAAIRSHKVGDRISMSLWRKGTTRSVSLTAADFPKQRASELAYRLLGVEVETLTEDRRKRYQLRSAAGVVISRIDPDCYLARIGAAPGDLIRQIDDLPVTDVADFENAVVKYRLKPSVVVQLERAGQGYYVTVRQ